MSVPVQRIVTDLGLQAVQFVLQRSDGARQFRAVNQIVQFGGVFLQVEELPFRLIRFIDAAGLSERVGVIVDELVAQGADAVVG